MSLPYSVTFHAQILFSTVKNEKSMQKEFEDTKGADRNRKSEDRQDHGQQNETKNKHRTHNTTLKTKAATNI